MKNNKNNEPVWPFRISLQFFGDDGVDNNGKVDPEAVYKGKPNGSRLKSPMGADEGSPSGEHEQEQPKASAGAGETTPQKGAAIYVGLVSESAGDVTNFGVVGGTTSKGRKGPNPYKDGGEKLPIGDDENDTIKLNGGDKLKNQILSVSPHLSVRLPHTDPVELAKTNEKYDVVSLVGGANDEEIQISGTEGFRGTDPHYHIGAAEITRDNVIPCVAFIQENDELDPKTHPLWPNKNNLHSAVSIDTNVIPSGWKRNYIPRTFEFTVSKDSSGLVTIAFDADHKVESASVKTPFGKCFDFPIKPTDKAYDEMDKPKKAFANHVEAIEKDMNHKATSSGDDKLHSIALRTSVCGGEMAARAALSTVMTIAQETGATLFEAFNAINRAYAYQFELLKKNGQRYMTVTEEMAWRLYTPNSSLRFNADGSFFGNYADQNKAEVGSPLFWLLFRETDKKFNDHADVLTLSTSFMHHALKYARKAGSKLHVSDKYIDERWSSETYSTVNPVEDASINTTLIDDCYALSYVTDPRDWENDGTKTNNVIFKYKENAQEYAVTIGHPLWTGLRSFLESKASKIATIAKLNNGKSISFKIPMVFSNTSITSWAMLLTMAADDISKRYQSGLINPVFAQYVKKHGVPFLSSTLEVDGIKITTDGFSTVWNKLDAHGWKNFSDEGYFNKKTPGVISGANATSWRMPEMLTIAGVCDAGTAQAVRPLIRAPWYCSPFSYSCIDDPSKKSQFSNKQSVDTHYYLNAPQFSYMGLFDCVSKLSNHSVLDSLSTNRMLDLDCHLDDKEVLTRSNILAVADTTSMRDTGSLCFANADGVASAHRYTYKWFFSRPRSKPYRSIVVPGGFITPIVNDTGIISSSAASAAALQADNLENACINNTSYILRVWHMPGSNHANKARRQSRVARNLGNMQFQVWSAYQASRLAVNDSTYNCGVNPTESLEYTRFALALNPYDKKTQDQAQLRASGDYRGASLIAASSWTLYSVPTDFKDETLMVDSWSRYEYMRRNILPFVWSPFDCVCSCIPADIIALKDKERVLSHQWAEKMGLNGFIGQDYSEVVVKFNNKIDDLGDAYLRGMISLKDSASQSDE